MRRSLFHTHTPLHAKVPGKATGRRKALPVRKSLTKFFLRFVFPLGLALSLSNHGAKCLGRIVESRNGNLTCSDSDRSDQGALIEIPYRDRDGAGGFQH